MKVHVVHHPKKPLLSCSQDGPKTKRAQSLRARVLAELGSSSAEEVKQRLVKELEEEGRKVASAKAPSFTRARARARVPVFWSCSGELVLQEAERIWD